MAFESADTLAEQNETMEEEGGDEVISAASTSAGTVSRSSKIALKDVLSSQDLAALKAFYGEKLQIQESDKHSNHDIQPPFTYIYTVC